MKTKAMFSNYDWPEVSICLDGEGILTRVGFQVRPAPKGAFLIIKRSEREFKRKRNTFPRYSALRPGDLGTADTTPWGQAQLPHAAALTPPARCTVTPRRRTAARWRGPSPAEHGGGARTATRTPPPPSPDVREARVGAGATGGRGVLAPTPAAPPRGRLPQVPSQTATWGSPAGSVLRGPPSRSSLARPLLVSCSEPNQWRPPRTETRKGQAPQLPPGLRASADSVPAAVPGSCGVEGASRSSALPLSRLFGVQAVRT